MAEMLKITSVGQGVSLVFIHGWGLNSGVWQPLVELLAKNYQVITVDLPGFGINRNCEITPYSVNNICQKISEVITQPAVFIGWSLGGLVATEMALNFPGNVSGLITVASSPCFVEQGVKTEKENNPLSTEVNHVPVYWPGIPSSVLNLFHRQLAENTQKTIEGFLKIQAMGSPKIRQDIKQVKALIMQYPLPTRETLEQSLNLLSSSDYRQQLINIDKPYLRMYGRLDSLVPKAALKLIEKLAPSSDEYLFEHASHAPFISHLDDFYQVLNRWLQKQKFS